MRQVWGSILTAVTGNHRASPQFPRGVCRLTTHALTASVGDGDRHTLDLDTVDVDGLHGLGRSRQLGCIQADDATSGGDLWQGTLFPENCSWVFFAGPARMGSAGCRAATSGGRCGCSCCWGAVLDKDRLHLTGRRTDVDLGGTREKKSVSQERLRSQHLSASAVSSPCPSEKWECFSVCPSLLWLAQTYIRAKLARWFETKHLIYLAWKNRTAKWQNWRIRRQLNDDLTKDAITIKWMKTALFLLWSKIVFLQFRLAKMEK